jgi:hypothetical protein
MLTTPGRMYPNSPVFWHSANGTGIATAVPQVVPMHISPMTPVNAPLAHNLSPTQYISGTPDLRALQYVSSEYSPRHLASTYDGYIQSGYGHAISSSPSHGQLHSPSSVPANGGDATFMRTNSSPGSGSGSGRDINDKNQIDLNKIAAGLDTRTTVMIKNIPNKLTDKDLIEYISKVCPRKIDFLYLRMDFQNGELCPLSAWIFPVRSALSPSLRRL